MLLKNLIKTKLSSFENTQISDLVLDSRKAKKGSIFFAIKGTSFDGNKFIKDAIKNGASAIVCSRKFNTKKNIPIVKVKNVKKILTQACNKFYKNKPKNIIAVTGTNGKSSVADFFHQILSLNKIPVASIGTLGVKKNNNMKKNDLTSPDIISLHKELEKIKKNKIDNVIIEASSHGLHQGRLDGVKFKAGVFTNFSQDHLDYHKSMKQYLNSKKILFKRLLEKNKYIITDSSLKEFSNLTKIAKKRKLKMLTINSFLNNQKKFSFPLIGTFQNKNFLMSVLASKVCGLSLKKIQKITIKVKSINGRLQLIRKLPNKTKVYIDYAHTPDALYTVLESLAENYKSKITLVFGCGGNRDITKRHLMAKVAKKFSDKIYVTDDNPRNENPKKIRQTIIKYLKKRNYIEIGNRAKAIENSIITAKDNEIILIAGKGHEDYQDYGRKIIKISDKSIIKKLKMKRNNYNKKNLNYTFNSNILNKIFKNKFNYKYKGVSINSKTIKKNNLFIAIKGKKKDGHRYVAEALKKGASYCVISNKLNKKNKKKLLKFSNTNNFLNQLAELKRAETKAKVIAITGSCGKTSVKTLLGTLLEKFDKTYYSPKSYNNHYGVPLSLANLEKNHKYGVFEIGMSRSGEIQKLSKLVKPNIGLITNIAEAHIENFKNLRGIAAAKGEIIKNINKKGVLVINQDDKFCNYFKNLARKRKIKVISFGISSKSDVYPVFIKNIDNYKLIKIKAIDEKLLIKVKNINILNLLSVIAVLRLLNLNLKAIAYFFNSFQSIEGRGKIYNVKRYKINFKLIDESYNANPLSVKNAITNLSHIKKNKFKKYLLLGDMLELGKKSKYFHKNLSKIINKTDIDKVFVYGEKVLNTYKYTKKSKQGNILHYKNDFDEVFSALVKKNDYLMIKGSNSTGLHQLSRNIIKGRLNAL